ncbi:FAD-dependent monooxygenase [Streptomyces sp. NBC_00273]|uniref:FAD-dependent monooxygenase n=1 Tax=Streptomyces sp. NBC_00273 TaxID=2903644 RepID=UPI002E2B602E|nr:FAD-dependent monooxygenase [Streptomyces sp. NBC_00273]
MSEIPTDFCIVGAGPAGLTLALLLLRSGARVTVLERSRSLEREYRGEILQPGGQSLLHDLGVLDGARARGCYEHDRFLLEENDRILINGDYRKLPGPFNCLLSIPQQHILQELLEQCRTHTKFKYLEATKCSTLITDSAGQVRGAIGRGPAGDQVVHAHCVIGADGRYSKVRRLAGVEYDRMEAFDQDVLWFKLPTDSNLPHDVRIFRAGGNPALAYASYPGNIQIGWTLPHKSYQQQAALGLDHIKAQLCNALPEQADRIQAEITSFKDLSLLDVFSGTAREWAKPGLLLIGDSAHTHGPIGAQGINVAIQDAVAAHPVLLASLRAGNASTDFLNRFATPRRHDIHRMMKIQAMQGKTMLSTGTISSMIRPRMAKLVSHTRLYHTVLNQLAFGNQTIRIRHELFEPGQQTPQ